MNTYIQNPEIVFLGVAGQGKSNVIESFLGHILYEGKNWKTKRPIHFRIVSNETCEKPVITIKRDITSKTYNADVKVTLNDLPSELAKRNTSSEMPLVIQYEFKDCWNLTIVDLPDISEDSVPTKVDELSADLTRASHRIVVAVENACDWGKSILLDLVKSIDMKLDRSIFVYNNFSSHIKNFVESKDVNQFFTSTLQGNNDESFFLSLHSDSEKATLQDVKKFQEHLESLEKNDIENLEQLKFNRRFASNIGSYHFKKRLQDMTWKIYQDNIPSVQNRLRALKANSEQTLTSICTRLDGLEPHKLRSAASNFVMNFLASVEKLIVGTLEGNPAQNGLTLTEEKEVIGEWTDENGDVIKLHSTKNIPYADTRIYGGQQFERLLAEFKEIALNVFIKESSVDEIATSSGPTKLNNISSLTWASSDLARIAINNLFTPLLDQLVKRATFIMKRLSDIAIKMMMATYKKNKARQSSGQSRTGTLRNTQQADLDFSPEEFPYYTHYVKDLYHDIVLRIAEECLEKCIDEFGCTKLIYWEVGAKIKESKKDKDMDPKDLVNKLTESIFNTIKTRLTRNLLLKCHNYFLVPMQSPLWGEIQSKISVISDDRLQELFEIDSTKHRLQDDEKNLQQILEKFGRQEELFQSASHGFSHPVKT